MDKLQHIVAIEIGSSKIIGAIATKSPEGKIQFEAMEEEHIVDYRESWQPFQIPEEALKKAEHIAGEVTKALTGAVIAVDISKAWLRLACDKIFEKHLA